jgi:biopolymer transport protein ExbD
MKIRKSAAAGVDKVEQQMTPMIDIVFQLLTFFLFSFKIVTPEGDFNIKMPVASQVTADITPPTLPIIVKLQATPEGKLTSILMNDKNLGTDFQQLRLQIIGIVGGDAGPGSAASEVECELDCDYNLHYDNVMKAIDAVSGYRENGQIVKLIQKIRFSPPKKPE